MGDPAVPYLAHLRDDAARIAAVTAVGPLDATVAGCPGWDLRDLVVHLGIVHQWATCAAATASEPTGDDWLTGPPETGAAPGDVADWYRTAAAALVDTLEDLDPDAPTWHQFPAEAVVGVWIRRQAQETSLHRWDAEQAVGAAAPIDPVLAADGIDEYFGLMLARRVARDGVTLPPSSLHVHCTDTAGEWTVQAVDGALECAREHRKGDAALRGGAQDLLLALWGRPVPDGGFDVVGDADAAAAWLAIGGV
jgi:uncharacterized protein (TIGR03083 family)